MRRKEFRSNGGITGRKSGKEPILPFSTEILDKITYVEDKSITHVLRKPENAIIHINAETVIISG